MKYPSDGSFDGDRLIFRKATSPTIIVVLYTICNNNIIPYDRQRYYWYYRIDGKRPLECRIILCSHVP